MHSRLLITGANGFVGNAVCKQAVRNGHVVRGAFRTDSYVPNCVEPFIVNNICGSTEWSVALREVNDVIHLAARVHVMQEIEADPLAAFRKVNVEGTLNLARQAAAFGVKRFVFVSSVKVNGETTMPGRAFIEHIDRLHAKKGFHLLLAGFVVEIVPPLLQSCDDALSVTCDFITRGEGAFCRRHIGELNRIFDAIHHASSVGKAVNQSLVRGWVYSSAKVEE